MKFFLFFILLFPVNLWAISIQNFKEEYHKIEKMLSERNLLCDKQYKEIIQKAYRQIPDQTNHDIYEFAKDEQLASTFISKFDPTLTANLSEYYFVNFILANCNEENSKIIIELESQRTRCSDIFDEFHFMQALIYATKNFNWSTETIVKAKKLILDYITTQNDPKENAILLVQLLSYDLLALMLEQSLLDKNHQKIILNAKNQAFVRSQQLKNELKKDSKNKTIPSLCDAYKKNINREALLGQKTRSELIAILKELPKK